MGFFDRLSNGWKLSTQSFAVLRKNKQLLIFPILSSLSLILLALSFLAVFLIPNNWDVDKAVNESNAAHYLILFAFYLVNYFVVIFFNMALIHCARIYFQGGNPTISDGLSFSMKKFNVILAWASITATIGLLLRLLQESGKIGEIVASILGIVWSVMTFFVVPVIAYENIGPIDAIKKSTSIMKEKWGESVGASFSFFLAQIVGFLLIVLPLFLLGMIVSVSLGVVLGLIGLFLLGAVISAAQTIFISAVYHKVNNEPISDFDNDSLDSLFVKKEKSGLF